MMKFNCKDDLLIEMISNERKMQKVIQKVVDIPEIITTEDKLLNSLGNKTNITPTLMNPEKFSENKKVFNNLIVPKPYVLVNAENDVPVNEFRDTYFISAEGSLMFVKKGGSFKEAVYLSNFSFTVKSVITIFDNGFYDAGEMDKRDLYELHIVPDTTVYFSKNVIVINIEDTTKVAKEIIRQCPQLSLNPRVQRAESHLNAHFSKCLVNADRKILLNHTGWTRINGIPCYAHGGGIISSIPVVGVYSNCDKRIEINPSIDIFKAKDTFLKLFNLSSDKRRISPLISYVSVSLLATLFRCANHDLNFVCYLLARTNSKKTTVAKLLCNIKDSSGKTPTACTKDTKTAIELKMHEYKDLCMILDDIHPTDSYEEQRTQLDLCSSVYRAIGDNNAKSRSSASLKRKKEYTPRGGVLITGEILLGNRSDLARAVVVEADENTFDVRILTELQKATTDLSTFWGYFLRYVSGRFDEIVNYIINRFEELRFLYSNRFGYARTIDNLITLQIGSEIVTEFLKVSGCLNEEEAQIFISDWVNALYGVVENSQTQIEAVHPGKLYIRIVQELLDSGIKKVLPLEGVDRDMVDAKVIGFFDDSYLYLLPEAAYISVKNRYQQQGKLFPLDKNATHAALEELNAIEYKSSRTERLNITREYRPHVIKLKKDVIDNVLSEEI